MEASLKLLQRIKDKSQDAEDLFCHSFDSQTCAVKIRTGLDKRSSFGSTDLLRVFSLFWMIDGFSEN